MKTAKRAVFKEKKVSCSSCVDMALFLLTKSVLLFTLKGTRKLDNPYLEIY